MGNTPQDKNRLSALKDLNILDSMAEQEYDDIVELASQICGTNIALVSFVDEHRQWFKSKKGLEVSETPIEQSFCAHAIQSDEDIFIIEEARKDPRFIENPLVTDSPNIEFYAGVPLIDENRNALGTLCVLHGEKISLTDSQKKGLKILAKNVVSLLALRKNNKELECAKKAYQESMDLNNPFFIIVDHQHRITQFGSNLNKVFPQIKMGLNLFDLGKFLDPFDFLTWKNSESTLYNGLAFFESIQGNQRFKCTVTKSELGIVILPSPLINAQYSLKNYNLGLNDFKKHDYIAEYVFLQQTADRALSDSRRILDSMVKKNKALTQAQNEIEFLATFPSENPNPIIRLDNQLKIIYRNRAGELDFAQDFSIANNKVSDKELSREIKDLISMKMDVRKLVLQRNERFWTVSIRYVDAKEYVNVYAAEITSYMEKIQTGEKNLKALYAQLDEQKSFYEFILNSIPADIAVFSTEHNYIFINPEGVKDNELRNWLIGKSDFDYVKLKNLPIELAQNRRDRFNRVVSTGMFENWSDEFITKEGRRKVVQRTLGPLYDESNQLKYVIGYGLDITKRVVAEDEIHAMTKFQRLLMDISTTYINIAPGLIRQTIQDSIQEIGAFVGVDRTYVFEYRHENQIATNTYEWCAEGISPQKSNLQKVDFKDIPDWIDRHTKGENIHINNVAELPPSRFKELIEIQDIKSLITVPMMQSGRCIGFVGMDAVKKVRAFSSNEIDLLSIFAKMLVNVEEKTKYVEEIETTKAQIQSINEGLEKQVQEKTQMNLELAKSLSDQEKLVTVGEIASGIAHDLNTPLGAIISGAGNIRFTLENLLHETIWKCSSDQIKRACDRAMDFKGELFVGGIKMRREQTLIKEFLAKNYPNLSETEMESLTPALVKIHFKTHELELMDEVLRANNKSEFLALIYHIQMARSFIDTILTSGERATNVIQNLRAFINERGVNVKSKVNLRQNIQTVLNIFNYELKRDIEVDLKVDEKLEIEGLDIKLFQLWSNLIKNAIESMKEMKDLKFIRIISQETQKTISISVENNGPKIPVEIQEKIFEKFFTTKGHKSGSGLGLSIVSSVVEEHNAEIEVKSNDLVTKFIITFKKPNL